MVRSPLLAMDQAAARQLEEYVGHYHPALTRRTAWPLGRNDIRRHVWRVIGRILRPRGRNEGCEQESSFEAGHPCLRSQANIVDTEPTLGEGHDVTRHSALSPVSTPETVELRGGPGRRALNLRFQRVTLSNHAKS